MKKEKLTKQQKLLQSKEMALALQRKLEVASGRLNAYVDKMQISSDNAKYMGDKKPKHLIETELARLDKAEDKAYKEFYNFMHKEFGSEINKSSVSFTSRKYKNGFVDRQYVKDMFEAKHKRLG